MTTLFTKIITGQIPSFKIYEDQYCFAFLDIYPHNPGHTLLVPKIEIAHFLDLPEPYYTNIFNNAKKIGKAIQKTTACRKVGLLINGMGVKDHFHLHLIPIFDIGDTDSSNAKKIDEVQAKIIQQQIIDNLN